MMGTSISDITIAFFGDYFKSFESGENRWSQVFCRIIALTISRENSSIISGQIVFYYKGLQDRYFTSTFLKSFRKVLL